MSRRIFSGLFFRYLAVYVAIFMLFAALLLPIRREVDAFAYQTVLSSNMQSVQESMTGIKSQVEKMQSIASTLLVNSDFMRIALLRGNVRNEDYLPLVRVQKELGNLHAIQGGTYGCYIVFRDNSIMLTESAIFTDCTSAYDTFLKYESMNVDQWRHAVFQSSNAVSYWGNDRVHYTYADALHRDVMSIVVQIAPSGMIHSPCVIVFMLDTDALIERFVAPELLSTGYILITDQSGRILAQRGNATEAMVPMHAGETIDIEIAGEAYTVFSITEPTVGLVATVGIPKLIIDQRVSGINSLVRLYTVIGLAGAVLLSILYATHQYRSMKKLVLVSEEITGKRYRQNNVVDYLSKTLDQLGDENDSFSRRAVLMQNAYSMSVLRSACRHGIFTDADQQEIDNLLGSEAWHIAVLRIDPDSDLSSPTLLTEAERAVTAQHMLQCVTVQTGHNEMTYIVHTEKQAVERSVSILAEAMKTLHACHGVNAATGIGVPFDHQDSLHACYVMATRALRSSLQLNRVVVFDQQMYDGAAAPSIFSQSAIYQLQEYILAGKQDRIDALFHELQSEWLRNIAHDEQMFMQLFFVIRAEIVQAQGEKRLQLLQLVLPEYSIATQRYALMQALHEAAAQQCAYIVSQRRSHNELLRDEMLRYVGEGYMRFDFSAGNVATRFSITEKYVYQFVKEHTGKPFGEYVEGLRLDSAETLLRQTKLTNEQIAQRCGFGSKNTYYRAFQKRHGVTPRAWRDIVE